MPNRTHYQKTARTGGGASALDGIAYASLLDGDPAVVTVSGDQFHYIFDDDVVGDESDPNLIAPDDAGAGNGRWVLQNLQVPDPTAANQIFDRGYADLRYTERLDNIDFVPIEWAEDGATPPDAAEQITTSNQTVRVRKFQGDTADQDVLFVLRAKPGISTATIKYRVIFLITEATAPSNEGVAFGAQGHCADLGDAFGNAVVITKTGMSDDQYSQITTDWSAAVTIANLADGKLAFLKFYRDYDHASDTYVQKIGIVGIDIQWI